MTGWRTKMDFKNKRKIYMIAAMILALCSGIGYAWSVFQKPLMENFDWALKTISITFTLQVMISTIAPVFLGRFQKIWGVKKYLRVGMAVYIIGLVATMFTTSIGYLYIVYGLIVGIGLAMLYPSLMAYATSLYPEKTGLASGLLASAYGSGAILWAPIATFFMKTHGVLSVFGLLGLIFTVVMVPLSFLITPVPKKFKVEIKENKNSKNVKSEKDYNWKEMLKTKTYYILLVTLTLGATAGLMIAGHASDMIQEILSLTPEKASIFVGLFSVFNALGRLVYGLLSDKLGRYNVMMILFAVIGCSMIIMAQASGVLFIIALLLVSSCYGGFTSMFSPVCADNFGMKNLAVNYGFLYIAYGLAGFIGPQIAARVKIISGGYQGAFYVVTVMAIVGILFILYLRRQMNSNRSLKEQGVQNG